MITLVGRNDGIECFGKSNFLHGKGAGREGNERYDNQQPLSEQLMQGEYAPRLSSASWWPPRDCFPVERALARHTRSPRTNPARKMPPKVSRSVFRRSSIRLRLERIEIDRNRIAPARQRFIGSFEDL